MAVLDDDVWAQIELALPPLQGAMGRPMTDHRPAVEGAIYRHRTGIAWRDMPAEFAPWQTVWKRHYKFSLDGTWDRVLAVLQAREQAAGKIDWRVSVDSTIARVHQHGSNTARRVSGPTSFTGGSTNYKVLPDLLHIRDEPDDHGIGRSRGGLTTKTHAIVDGAGRPLVIGCTPGQSNDSPALPRLLAELRVETGLPGRPRTTPDALLGDKAYSARAHRTELRRRGIKVVIPEPSDQAGHRKRKGSRGGRPVSYDVLTYRNRNVVEQCFNTLKMARGPQG